MTKDNTHLQNFVKKKTSTIKAAQCAHKKQHAPTIQANSAFPSQLLFSHIQPCIT